MRQDAYPDARQEQRDVVVLGSQQERPDGAPVPDALDDGLDGLPGEPVDELAGVLRLPGHGAHVAARGARRDTRIRLETSGSAERKTMKLDYSLGRPHSLAGRLCRLLGLEHGRVGRGLADLGQALGDELDGDVFSLLGVVGSDEHGPVFAT